ncbi:NUDIX domain-containing protein [Chryseobacterium cucumeris]|uniref:NUDIX domain-containing protein n=1 Tax=Chryseobacterium cucumeris TaxID=1813611 RepID=UPI003D99AD30
MKTSSGILLFKKEKDSLYYFLVHPGGPFWRNKDSGAWSIPKGEILPDEDPLVRALTEFKEETGKVAEGQFIELSPIRQKGGKTVYAWALEGDIDTSGLYSNSFPLEWPPKSGKFPKWTNGNGLLQKKHKNGSIRHRKISSQNLKVY